MRPDRGLPRGTWPGMACQPHQSVCPGRDPRAVAAARCRWKGTRRAPRSAPEAGTSRRPRPPRDRRLRRWQLVPLAEQQPGPPSPGRYWPARRPPAQARAALVWWWRASAARSYRRVVPAGHWPGPGRPATRPLGRWRALAVRWPDERVAARRWPLSPAARRALVPSGGRLSSVEEPWAGRWLPLSWTGHRPPRSWAARRPLRSWTGLWRSLSVRRGQRRRPRLVAQPARRRACRAGHRRRARPVDG